MNIMRDQFGFTLLEVLIVTALLAIGAAVTVWGVNHLLPDLRLKAAARDLKTNMHLARLAAIQHDTFIVSEFNDEANSYTIFLDDGGGDITMANNYRQDDGERILKTARIHPTVSITRARFGAVDGRFAFNSRGTLQGLAGGVYLRNTQNSYRGVAVSRIGKITIKTSSDGMKWHPLN